MTEPTHLRFVEDTPPGPAAADIGPSYVEMARAIAAICATRVLLLIAVLTGSVIWVWTTWQPTQDRLFVAVAFSLVFVLPQVFLYHRKG
jgi:uncharacterized membrane protein YcjF (UPF0283 family)